MKIVKNIDDEREAIKRLEKELIEESKEFKGRDGELRNQPVIVKKRKRWKSPYEQINRTKRR